MLLPLRFLAGVISLGVLPLIAAPNEAAPLKPIGQILPRSAQEIESSDWSIGCEVLDRDFASYAAYKKYLGPLGAKAVRLQAGWAKTEKTPGHYDWNWLDEIIDDTRAQGTQPWVQLSYGNPAYPGGGGKNIGDTGPITPEAIAAWDRWARAVVQRYRDRVNQWEIWNESDISTKMSFEAYVALYVRTATMIRAEQPKARIYALSLAHKVDYAERFLEAIAAEGKLDLIDAITFHGYPHNPDDLSVLEGLRKVVAKFPRPIELRQGETGAPSQKTTGALSNFEWTDLKQAKWNLRRMLAHHGHGVPFNLFTLSDFFYPTGRNAKGLLEINADHSVTRVKPSYYAAQNVFSIFDSTFSPLQRFKAVFSPETVALATYAFTKSGANAGPGVRAVAVWFNSEPPRDNFEPVPIDISFPGAKFEAPVCVDLRTGMVYEVPATHWTATDGGADFRRLPVSDSPMLIVSRGDVRFR